MLNIDNKQKYYYNFPIFLTQNLYLLRRLIEKKNTSNRIIFQPGVTNAKFMKIIHVPHKDKQYENSKPRIKNYSCSE